MDKLIKKFFKDKNTLCKYFRQGLYTSNNTDSPKNIDKYSNAAIINKASTTSVGTSWINNDSQIISICKKFNHACSCGGDRKKCLKK